MKAIHPPVTQADLTPFDRIVLHLRCLYHDHKLRWHLAGVWRELRPSQYKQSHRPPREARPA